MDCIVGTLGSNALKALVLHLNFNIQQRLYNNVWYIIFKLLLPGIYCGSAAMYITIMINSTHGGFK